MAAAGVSKIVIHDSTSVLLVGEMEKARCKVSRLDIVLSCCLLPTLSDRYRKNFVFSDYCLIGTEVSLSDFLFAVNLRKKIQNSIKKTLVNLLFVRNFPKPSLTFKNNIPFIISAMNDENTRQLVLRTHGMRVNALSQVMFAREFIDIFPETGEWNIENVSILLNELKTWKEAERLHIRESNGSKYMSFLFQNANQTSSLRIHVTLSGKVSASVCTHYLCTEWQSVAGIEVVNKDNRGRPLKKPQSLLLIHYKKIFRFEQDGSLVILLKKKSIIL